MPTFTQGPDPCKKSLNCIELHDDPPELIGDLTNCCCCNTCFSVRPGSPDLINTNWTHCCRCVPRLIFLQFIPDDPDDPCCAAASIPMVNGGTVDDPWPITTYTAGMFGATVTVELGRFDAGSGYGAIVEDGDCAWRIVATKAEDGLDVDEYFPIDHDTRSCLDVSGISIGSITGPAGCTGTLQLANYEVAHLPFILREDIPSVTETGVPDEPEFITLYPPCGECEQVCSKLCVWGHRILGGPRKFVEFNWLDYGDNRGWSYFNESTDETEYIWLVENEYGECELVFDWTGSEPIANQVIDPNTACSCRMKEVVTASVDLETIGFTIRCGVCTSWNFFCGTCRCVPLTLCAQTYIDNVFTESLTLTWDSTEMEWTDGYDLAIRLEAGSDGSCKLVPYVSGTALESTATRDCGDEHQSDMVGTLGKRHDPGNDFINAEFSDFLYDSLIFIRISSLLEDCKIGACSNATPCRDECGSHPPVLIVNAEGVNEEDPYSTDCDVSITVYYWESVTWAGDLDYSCGYTGFAFVGFCDQVVGPPLPKWVRADLTDGGITFSYYLGSSVAINCSEIIPLVESCDPYLGTTDWIEVGLQDCCWGCDEQITKLRITVTEPA